MKKNLFSIISICISVITLIIAIVNVNNTSTMKARLVTEPTTEPWEDFVEEEEVLHTFKFTDYYYVLYIKTSDYYEVACYWINNMWVRVLL